MLEVDAKLLAAKDVEMVGGVKGANEREVEDDRLVFNEDNDAGGLKENAGSAPAEGLVSKNEPPVVEFVSVDVVVGTFDTKDDNACRGFPVRTPTSSLLSGVWGGVISSY